MELLEKYCDNVNFYKEIYGCSPSELGILIIYKLGNKYKIVKTNKITNDELSRDNIFYSCLIPNYKDMYFFIADMYFEREDKDGLYDFNNQELIEILTQIDFEILNSLHKMIGKLMKSKHYITITEGMKRQSQEIIELIKQLYN